MPFDLTGVSVVYTVEFAPNGKWFAVGHTGRSSKLDLFDWNDGAPTKIPFAFSRSSEIHFMAWSPDSNSLALINDGEFQIIDWSTGTPVLSRRTNVAPFNGDHYLSTLGWTSDSKKIVVSQSHTSSSRGVLTFYNVAIGGRTSIITPLKRGVPGKLYATQWSPSNDLFFIVINSSPFFQILDSGTFHDNAWQLVHMDGPEFVPGDFITV